MRYIWKFFFNVFITLIGCVFLSMEVSAYNSNSHYEYDTDRPGYDYNNFNLPENNPALCKQACDRDNECKAWTFVKPGYQGPSPRCWLKYAVPNPVPNKYTISGVKRLSNNRGLTKIFNKPSLLGYRLDWCKVWGSQCGKPAADEFCKQNGFSYAVNWAMDPDIGLHSPTKVIGTGQICDQAMCDGFKYITCAGKGNNADVVTHRPKSYNLDKYYIGCFKDSGHPTGTQGRDLNGFIYQSKDMTPEMCIDMCNKKGFKYASVQYSSFCFCGNSYGKYGPANNCNMKCSGDPKKICGGFWANSVYRTYLTEDVSTPTIDTSPNFSIESCAVYKYKMQYLYGYIDENLNQDTKTIFLSCMIKNAPQGTIVTANWYYQSNTQGKILIASVPFTIKNIEKSNYAGYLTFTLEPPEGKNLPSGTYEVVITHRKTPIKTISFTYR